MKHNQCQCRKCIQERKDGTFINDSFFPKELTQMILCENCGNKRCPHATNHNYLCTDSNEPGQEVSYYK